MKRITCAAAAFFLAASLSLLAFQSSNPIAKPALWKLLQDGSLPAEDLIQMIEERGLAFELTADDVQQLGGMKVDAGVMEALKRSARGPADLPDGPPLTENQVLLLLEAQVPSRTVSRLVEKRKAAFPITAELGQKLTAAGARPGLIGTITLNPAPNTPPPPPPSSAVEEPPAAAAEPAAPAPAAAGPIKVPAEEMARRLRSASRPVYPSLARSARVEGTVTLEIIVGADGVVKAARAIKGPTVLRQPALDAVQSFRYEPYLSNGTPVEVQSETLIGFSMQ